MKYSNPDYLTLGAFYRRFEGGAGWWKKYISTKKLSQQATSLLLKAKIINYASGSITVVGYEKNSSKLHLRTPLQSALCQFIGQPLN